MNEVLDILESEDFIDANIYLMANVLMKIVETKVTPMLIIRLLGNYVLMQSLKSIMVTI